MAPLTSTDQYTMNLLTVLSKRSKWFYISIILLGGINGIFNGLIIALIQTALGGAKLPYVTANNAWMIFVGLSVTSFVISRVFQTYMIRLSNELLFEFETSILSKLRFANYEALEKIGQNRVYTAIGDARALGEIPNVFIGLINAAIVVLVGITYLFIISPESGFSLLGIIGVLLVIYLVRNVRIEKELNVLRDIQNDYFRYLKDLLFGFKEIKMSIKRNDNLYNNYLKDNRETGRQIQVSTSISYLDNQLSGSYSWYIIMGIILFVLPTAFGVPVATLGTILFIVLFLMGPITQLIGVIPYYTKVKIALERLNELDDEVDARVRYNLEHGDLTEINAQFDSIRFEDVTYEYFDERKQKAFILGPVSVSFGKGELIFITGGNGSGKSTFVNLLTGLYKPKEGNIYLNGTKISMENYAYYCDQITAIFTNNYLFEENYNGFDLKEMRDRLDRYITKMRLHEVLEIDEENNRIKADLSKGQQKRLAMIYALMEDRKIMVLDEWAAEQDPEFRAFFYEKLLPELQSMGKTIVAITHDDAYYQHADRIVKFDFGKIISDQQMKDSAAIEENSNA